MSAMASKDVATHAALDLIHCLSNPTPATPFLMVGNEQMNALRKLAEIFNTSLMPPQQFIPYVAPPQMVAPVTMPCLHTAKPVAQGQHTMSMHYTKHSPSTVPMHANKRVNIPNSPPVNFNTVSSPTQ
eukprot:7252200-Ditylum_brightwellii.AAC.1